MVEAVQDNRRAIVRVASNEVLKGLADAARVAGGDMISLLVFTGIWVANVQHIVSDTKKYAAFLDIPPDSQRRPVTEDELERQTCIPQPILGQYVEALVGNGTAERLPGGGLVIPSAVFTRTEQLDATNEIYTRLISLVTAMRAAGFRFGDEGAAA